MGKCRYWLAPKIKGYVEWQLQHYHEDKRQLEKIKNDMMPSAMTSYSLTAGCGCSEIGRPTEKAALEMATNTYILTIERSINAVEAVLGRCDEIDAKLIELVYWRRTYTVRGAADKTNLSFSGAYKRINRILYDIAYELGCADSSKALARGVI